ncbi:DUF2799 domain-containing protein [Chitinimonas koreensis]|uniref:DUF2799 domain-containing protein n=1 Tax=Chitinimonas koreensis TaxID=356302 RepID=UPI0006860BE4|nr:DUF2799 domain-containing protein [Chitinimonas koreensis]QNM95796.1 DUF2799 domain-containing protein [Chitinimonas koreensis]
MKRIVLLASLALLGGCAAMSEAECRSGDWYGVGERDGREGRSSQLGAYAEACQKVAVMPDAGEYSRGRERGLRAYCTPENGYHEGRNGQSYGGVCAPELQAAFLREYERGRERYELRRDIDALENDIANWGRELDRLADQIAKAPNEDERNKLRRMRESRERDRRDARIRLMMLQTRWSVMGD